MEGFSTTARYIGASILVGVKVRGMPRGAQTELLPHE